MTASAKEIGTLLAGKRGLVIGIANDQSIAWGCAKAFHALGAEVAVTYLNDKASPMSSRWPARSTRRCSCRWMSCRTARSRRYSSGSPQEWGQLDFVLHSIAYSPREALAGRVTDVEKPGFLTTMDVSCWSFIRTAHLAEPLMKNGGTLFTMSYYGAQAVVENYNIMGVAKAALESSVRYIAAELGPKGIRVHAISPGPLATRAASGIPEFDELLDKARAKAPSAQPCQHRGCRHGDGISGP
jgi:enoyl-[acyl-carrier protein] reductase I